MAESGRRTRFKISYPSGCAGSNPARAMEKIMNEPEVYTEDEVIDVTWIFENDSLFGLGLVKAERKGTNTLILREFKDRTRRVDGSLCKVCLDYWWHRNCRVSTRSVLGTERTWWKDNEIDQDKCLFEQVNLF